MKYVLVDYGDSLTEEKSKETMQALGIAAAPLVEFVNKHCCPHDAVVIQQGHVDLYSGRMGYPTEVPD